MGIARVRWKRGERQWPTVNPSEIPFLHRRGHNSHLRTRGGRALEAALENVESRTDSLHRGKMATVRMIRVSVTALALRCRRNAI
jgi:hypothetical protein